MGGIDAAKRLCGCTNCGGCREGECHMLGVLPYVLRADADSARYHQLASEIAALPTPVAWWVGPAVVATAALAMCWAAL